MAQFSSSSLTCLNNMENDQKSKEDKTSGESDSKSLKVKSSTGDVGVHSNGYNSQIVPPEQEYSSSVPDSDGPQQSTQPIDIPSPSSARTSLSSFSFRDGGSMNSLRRSPRLFPCDDHFSPGDLSPPPIRRLSQLSEKMQMFYLGDDRDNDNNNNNNGVLIIGEYADRAAVTDETVSTSYRDVKCAECYGDIGCHRHHMHLQSAYEDQHLQCHEW